MNKETRINNIEELLNNKDPIGEQELMWEDQLQPMKVYKVPLEYLIYNKYNGRILSRTTSLEARGHQIDPESEQGKKLVEKLLFDTNEGRNKRTLADIAKYGQKQVGIITRDGIIIDGNRRAMLLNRLDEYDYFKAIILPVKLEDSPIEIQKLETSYQMGEDEKLTYNATEKYLKAKQLVSQGVTVKQIATWMGESEQTINDYLSVMDLMDEYLEYLGYNRAYTQLDKREDLFLNLNKWVTTFVDKNGVVSGSVKAFDNYTASDVDDLKVISFDYIRARYEGKGFRILAQGLRDKHFFGDKTIWDKFSKSHFKKIEPIREAEGEVNFDSPDIKSTLDNRDEKFRLSVAEFLDDNINEHEQYLYYKDWKNEPDKLISKSIESINVARNNENITSESVLAKVEELNQITNDILLSNSPSGVLSNISNQLRDLNLATELKNDNKEEVLNLLKDISSLAYRLEKEVKSLRE